MTIRFVASGASNTSPYETWAKACTSLTTALAASTGAGDVIVIKYNGVPAGDAELSVDTIYAFAGHISLISASADDANTAFTPTVMGTANWIGNSTTNRYIRFSGVDLRCYVYGVTFRTAGSTADNISLATSTGQHVEVENCYLWAGNTGTAGAIALASAGAFAKYTNCTFRFGATGQYLESAGGCEIVGGSVSSAGSTPTTLFGAPTAAGYITATGFDMSLITGTLCANQGIGAFKFTFDRCEFGAGVTVLAAQTSNPSKASSQVFVSDCASGDTHGLMGYYDALGSVTSDTGIYFTAGAAAQSWKIVTTANASYRTPFITPWIDLYNTATSSITPYLEILRDGSATAYKNSEVWGEFSIKTTSGFTTSTESADRQAVGAFAAGTAGADQTTGAGAGSWTGEGGTAWFGKVDSGSAMTPAENGSIRARVMVAAASATVYVDPQIRT